jgi:hypothetical protein
LKKLVFYFLKAAMVFENLLFIRGIIVSESALRVLMGRRFINLWIEFQKYRKTHQDDEAWELFLEECDPCSIIESKLELKIYNYPCCSELQNKKFIIGIEFGKVGLWEDAYNHVTSPPELPDHIDEEVKNKVKGYADCLDWEPQTIVVLDDCVSCS